MPSRDVIFGSGEFYHIFNRTIGRENIFTTAIHLRKILEITNYYRFSQTLRLSKFKLLPDDKKQEYLLLMSKKEPIVEIYSFAFMPNHFHFLLKQISDDGILRFISAIQNSYAKYFNLKYARNGGLFQEQFKGKWIENDELFLHISRYIHLNPVTAFMLEFKDLSNYPWTSYSYFQKPDSLSLLNTSFLIEMCGSIEKYNEFVEDNVDFQRDLAELKDLFID